MEKLNKLIKILNWCKNNKDKTRFIKLNCEMFFPFDNLEIEIVLENEQDIIFYNSSYDIGADEDIKYSLEDIERILNVFSK